MARAEERDFCPDRPEQGLAALRAGQGPLPGRGLSGVDATLDKSGGVSTHRPGLWRTGAAAGLASTGRGAAELDAVRAACGRGLRRGFDRLRRRRPGFGPAVVAEEPGGRRPVGRRPALRRSRPPGRTGSERRSLAGRGDRPGLDSVEQRLVTQPVARARRSA
ncbi:hypothetical protein ACRAWD_12135 [Caulobacter segnis]